VVELDRREETRQQMRIDHVWKPAKVLVLLLICASCSTPTADVVDEKAARNYLTGYPALVEGGLVNAVIEIPAGTNEKWELTKNGESIELEIRDGEPRIVQYLAYPANYGMIPGTLLPEELGGDGDALDVIVLGSTVERGSVIAVHPIALLRLIDQGERDDKVIAVQMTGPLSGVTDFDSLEAGYPGVFSIVETWFTHYKGAGQIESHGVDGPAAAIAVVEEASRHFVSAIPATASP
jgi:inorganic pyrophosphatase